MYQVLHKDHGTRSRSLKNFVRDRFFPFLVEIFNRQHELKRHTTFGIDSQWGFRWYAQRRWDSCKRSIIVPKRVNAVYTLNHQVYLNWILRAHAKYSMTLEFCWYSTWNISHIIKRYNLSLYLGTPKKLLGSETNKRTLRRHEYL